jgi:hypothetical protein
MFACYIRSYQKVPSVSLHTNNIVCDAVLLGRLCVKTGKYIQNHLHVFVHNKYTALSSVRMVALRSVDKIFPESCDFEAREGAAS